MAELKRVLAATDGSEHGARAVVTAASLARRAGAALDVISVLEVLVLPAAYLPPGVEPGEHEDAFVEEARRTAAGQARHAGRTDAAVHVRAGMAAPVIAEQADEGRADLVVVGAHPRPALARTLVGSTAERVLRLAHCPVMVAVDERRLPFRRVLAAIDLSGQSRAVLETAAAIARIDRAEVRALFVEEPLPSMLVAAAVYDQREALRHSREQMEKCLEEAALPSGVIVDGRMRKGRSGDEILSEAQDWDAHLIVVGSHGFSFLDRLLLGSTSLHVLRHAERAIVVVPHKKGDGPAS